MKRIILITGASSGIGRAITGYLASKGDVVYAGARKEKDIELLNGIANVTGIQIDVTRPEEISEVVERIRKEYGFLDCLINNAGVMGWGAVIDRDLSYYHSVFEVNVWGAIRMVKACYPLLKQSVKRPAIFNISSQGENYTLPFWSPYMMSKHAMKAFSASLRREMLAESISVIGIAPGAFKSKMLEGQRNALNEYENSYSSEFTPKVVKMLGIPVRKDRKHERSPVEIGRLIYRVINSSRRKARYQPGRKFIPDVILDKFPTAIVDKLIMKMLD